MFRIFRTLVVLVVLVLVAGVGIFVYTSLSHVTSPGPTQLAGPSAAPSTAPAAAATADPNLIARLSSTEARIRQDAASGKHEPMTVTMSEAELNALITTAMGSGQVPAPVSGVSATIVPGQVNISGTAGSGVLSAPFTMTAVPKVGDGKAQLSVTGISFKGLSVPQSISQQMTSAVSSDNLLGDLPFKVTSFRAEQGRLVLEGTT